MVEEYDVIIAGGGLAGLTSAIQLAREKINVLLIEKKTFPFHKVCGEYVSNEVLRLLKGIGFDPFYYGASRITKLRISTPSGKNIYTKLDPGGFGLSRYVMDNALADIARKSGAKLLTGTKVTDIVFADNRFEIKISSGKMFSSKIVIGSYGKRDALDKKLNRDFINDHTGYLGVKYHLKTDYPQDEVGLDNFDGGYCGIAKIEDDKFNLCYLYRRSSAINFNSVSELEKKVLFRNPVIKNIFCNSEFIHSAPEVINEISFAPKQLIENHILMCGDSAGLITPLCGNGMAMAFHSAKIVSDIILKSGFLSAGEISTDQRRKLEITYHREWKKKFSNRLEWGRRIQTIFGKPLVTGFGINFIHSFPALEQWLISKTHGEQVA